MDIEITFSNQKDALLLNNEVPKGVSLIIPPIYETKDFALGMDTTVTIIISVGTGIPASLVAAWIYDKLKHHRSRQITINRKEILFSQGEVKKVIEESIKINE